jgi:hypothetical protein
MPAAARCGIVRFGRVGALHPTTMRPRAHGLDDSILLTDPQQSGVGHRRMPDGITSLMSDVVLTARQHDRWYQTMQPASQTILTARSVSVHRRLPVDGHPDARAHRCTVSGCAPRVGFVTKSDTVDEAASAAFARRL